MYVHKQALLYKRITDQVHSTEKSKETVVELPSPSYIKAEHDEAPPELGPKDPPELGPKEPPEVGGCEPLELGAAELVELPGALLTITADREGSDEYLRKPIEVSTPSVVVTMSSNASRSIVCRGGVCREGRYRER